MNISQAKTLHLPTLLEKAGAWLDPAKSHPQQDSYFFKLRDEDTASVHVWRAPNGTWCWKDHGSGEGGDIIKFGQYMVGRGSVSDGLKWLDGLTSGQTIKAEPRQQPQAAEPRQAKYTVEKVKHLFEKPYNKNLLAFINSRAVSAKIVAKYAQEIHFADERKKKMFGLGLKAEPTDTQPLGSWEIRTALDGFPKCVIGDKNVSVIDSPGLSRRSVHIFEGMFDFFTWLEMTGQHEAKHPPAPVIVLNSANMAARAAEILNTDKRFAQTQQAVLWPQNDRAGQDAVFAFAQALDTSRFTFGTMEHIYPDHKDLSECWSKTPEADRLKISSQSRRAAPMQKVYDTSASAEARRAHEEKVKNNPLKLF